MQNIFFFIPLILLDNSVKVRALELFLILHMDHEQNASTSTVRNAGSFFFLRFFIFYFYVAWLVRWKPEA